MSSARFFAFAGLVLLMLPAGCSRPPQQAEPRQYYLDCAGGNDAADGLTPGTAWRSLDRANRVRLGPGDSLLLKRGTQCPGTLWPKGSGSEGKPITLGAYGVGAQPIIDASGQEAGIRLFNQEYWHIENVAVGWATTFGISVRGDTNVLRHFRITNVTVSGMRGLQRTKRAGCISFWPRSSRSSFADIGIDGVWCHDSTQWAGIIVDGKYPPSRLDEVDPLFAERAWYRLVKPEGRKVDGIVIRNSIVHEVAGDGIAVFNARNALIERNAAWLTGMQEWFLMPGQNPNAIWMLSCEDCVISHNEAFLADSRGVDGGAFDVDWGSVRSRLEHNFGHDSAGYCISLLGAFNRVTTDSVIRYNLCLNNGRNPMLARRQGDFYFSTWAGGSIDGFDIAHNTFVWNPPLDTYMVAADTSEGWKARLVLTGSKPRLFRDNLMISTVPSFVTLNGDIDFNHNLYWNLSGAESRWSVDQKVVEGFEVYRRKTGLDAGSIYGDPRIYWPSRVTPHLALRLMPDSPAIDAASTAGKPPAQDIFSIPVPQGKAPDIGAAEFLAGLPEESVMPPAPAAQLRTLSGETFTPEDQKGRWLLLSFLETDPAVDTRQGEDSKSQTVFLRSAQAQYHRRGLRTFVVASQAEGTPAREDLLTNLAQDWHLDSTPLLLDDGALTAAKAFNVTGRPATFLISPEGRVAQKWEGFVFAAPLVLALRSVLGPPHGMATFPGETR